MVVAANNDAGSDETASMYAVEVVVELYRRRVWCATRRRGVTAARRDGGGGRVGSKTVNVLALAALSLNSKLAAHALRFFLSNERDDTDALDDANKDELASLAARRTEMLRQQVTLPVVVVIVIVIVIVIVVVVVVVVVVVQRLVVFLLSHVPFRLVFFFL